MKWWHKQNFHWFSLADHLLSDAQDKGVDGWPDKAFSHKDSGLPPQYKNHPIRNLHLWNAILASSLIRRYCMDWGPILRIFLSQVYYILWQVIKRTYESGWSSYKDYYLITNLLFLTPNWQKTGKIIFVRLSKLF